MKIYINILNLKIIEQYNYLSKIISINSKTMLGF